MEEKGMKGRISRRQKGVRLRELNVAEGGLKIWPRVSDVRGEDWLYKTPKGE